MKRPLHPLQTRNNGKINHKIKSLDCNGFTIFIRYNPLQPVTGCLNVTDQ